MKEAEKEQARELVAQMLGVWNVESVDAQPQLTLERWQILETDKNERHFVGWNVTDREGRVSSAIESFDPKTMRGVTRSGRCYQLKGPPGEHPDAVHTWGHWMRINAVMEFKDVSAEVLQP